MKTDQEAIAKWNDRHDDWISTRFAPKDDCLVLVSDNGNTEITSQFTVYEYTDELFLYELGECYKILDKPKE